MGLAALAGCAPGTSTKDSTVLIFGRNKDATNLDPALATDGLSLTLDQVMLEGLTKYAPGSFRVEPSLAESWTVNRSGTVWTFRLRRGVKFQDGTPFDAAAVKFNFDRWRLANHPYHKWGNFTYYKSQFGGLPGAIQDVEVRGAYTVTLYLSRRLAPLLANLAMPAFAISSPSAIRTYGEGYFRRPVGTGPYALTEWVKDDHITLQRFSAYWGTKARIPTVVIRDFPDAGVARLALQHGDIDGWEYPQPDDVAVLRRDPLMHVYYRPSNSAMYVAINTQRPPFGNVLVRRAINEAIDARTIAKTLFDPSAHVAQSFLPPVVWPQGSVTAYAYDPAHARRLLAEAGFPHGFGTRLWYMTAPRPYLPQPERVAEAIQANLRSVGIDARLEGFEFAVFLQRVMNGEHDLTLAGWTGDNGDPDNFLYPTLDPDNAHPPGYNLSFWKDDRYHRLILRAQAALNNSERRRLYLEALTVVHDQAPVVPIVHTTGPIVYAARVGGVIPTPDGSELFQYLYFKH